MYCCSRVIFIYMAQAKSLKQFSMLIVNKDSLVIPISVISGYIISNHHNKSSHLRMDWDTFRNCRFLIVHWVAFATFLGSIPDHFLFWAHNVSVNTRTLDTNGNKWYNQHGYSMYCSVLEWTLASHKEQIEWNKYVKYYISAYEIDMWQAIRYDI